MPETKLGGGLPIDPSPPSPSIDTGLFNPDGTSCQVQASIVTDELHTDMKAISTEQGLVEFSPDDLQAAVDSWVAEFQTQDGIPQPATIMCGGDSIVVIPRFVGINHGNDDNGNPTIFEVSVYGNPENSAHQPFINIEHWFAVVDDLITDFNSIVASIPADSV